MKKKEKEIKSNIPDDVKVVFGKFYVFSFIIILLLSLLYPFVIINYFSIYSQIGFLIFVLLFYGYMVFKLFKKKGKFMSLLVPLLIVSVLLLLVLDLLKLIDFI